jgi:hypothetical protein
MFINCFPFSIFYSVYLNKHYNITNQIKKAKMLPVPQFSELVLFGTFTFCLFKICIIKCHEPVTLVNHICKKYDSDDETTDGDDDSDDETTDGDDDETTDGGDDETTDGGDDETTDGDDEKSGFK